jgi:hypothetical protein
MRRAEASSPNRRTWYQLKNLFIAGQQQQSVPPHSISFYDFSTRKTRDIFKNDRDLHDGISISPDGRYMLYSQLDENDSNIMLVSNFH